MLETCWEKCLVLVSLLGTVYGSTLPIGFLASFCVDGEFACLTAMGISCQPDMYKCDGHQDCLDSGDERNCPGKCYGNEFRCKSATGYQCINDAFVCDGIRDCTDGSDELGCQDSICLEGEFSCITKNGLTCQPNIYKCDGEKDCLDNSDESNCSGETVKRNDGIKFARLLE